jgi:Ca-activated chloride channel family protein
MNEVISQIPVDDPSLQFARVHWIYVGVGICAVMVAMFTVFDRQAAACLEKLIHPRFRTRLVDGFSSWRRNFKRVLWLLGIGLLFTALAGPRKGYEWHEVKRKGIDILFAVDTSRSMLAEDLAPNRLERAKLGILDFVERLESDRVGLIPFAGSAFALCPLTLDYDSFRESLEVIDTDLIPKQGTDLASAIKEAERLFDQAGNNRRILVLMTDGEDLQGDVVDAAKAAAKKGMTIYTLGVGSAEGATIPIRDPNGRTDFVRDENGKVVKTRLDEAMLKKIAETTDGMYVPLGRGAEGLDTIYQERLRLVPKSEMEQRMERIPLERFEWPLGFALVLLVSEFFLGERRRVKPVRPPAAAVRKLNPASKVSSWVLAGLMSFHLLPEATAAETLDPRMIYNKGTESYGKGDFAAAAESLKRALRTPDLALQQRAYYNLGNTLYRTGQNQLEKEPEAAIKSWEESIKAYDDALALNALDPDASYNKEFVEKKLEELKKQQQEQKKDDSNKDKDSQDQDDSKQDDNQESQKDSGKPSKDGEKDSKQGEDSESAEKNPSEDGKEGKPGEQDPQETKDGSKENQEGASKESKDQQGEEGGKAKDGKDGGNPMNEKGESDGSARETSEEGEQKNGESKPGEPKPGEVPAGEIGEERGQRQEMTAEEARQLIEALRNDNRTVVPIPQNPRGRFTTDSTTKGKTW